MNTLNIGDEMPSFECLDENENTLKSEDFIGKKTIIFFYPRANTPGCTAEACNLSENYNKLTDSGYQIIGVSCDKPKSQKNFSTKFKVKILMQLKLYFYQLMREFQTIHK